MCGIAGYMGRAPLAAPVISAGLDKMINRGPDRRASALFNSGEMHVALLHSRLSIIDLDARSDQPFTIGNCTIVFNGEIYNYIELRKVLESEGVAFHTASDTEVLLQAYIRYGEDCVSRLEGMWSFAVYDRDRQKLFLSRDRFAEKPLYYLSTPEGFWFGSEIKFIKALYGKSLRINNRQLLRYLVNGYKSLYKTEDTFFEEVREVRYATNLSIGSDLRPRLKRYWQPAFTSNPEMTLDEAVEGARHCLSESMRIRLRSDVPLAFCLSGGVDSAALASIAAKTFNYDVATFSIIDSDPRYNEKDLILETVRDLGCRHTLIDIPSEESLPRLRRLISYHDAPVATISYHVHSLVSEAVSAGGYRVAFSGTSADELFTGYYDHYLLHLNEIAGRPDYGRYLDEWRRHVAVHVRNPLLKDPDLYARNPLFREHVYDNSAEFKDYLKEAFSDEFTEEHFCESLLRNRMLNELFHEATPVILHEDDLNSMMYSVENRSPYLDTRLFEFAYSIPPEHLIRDGFNKYVLREAVKGILNEPVRTSRQKKGFNASIYSVVDFDRKENRDWLLEPSEIYRYVDRDRMAALIRTRPQENSYSKFLFNFMNAKYFLEMN
jgi:asparagine synthase (glutamine-hydrolysing)